MHIYFSAIGGMGIGPLALLTHQAGFDVSGSDKADSKYIELLKNQGIKDIYIGNDQAHLAKVHRSKPIDWLVYSSAMTIGKQDNPEIDFCLNNGIKISKRDEFINYLIDELKLSLVAVAGTHGKTTTTAMLIWLFQQIGEPVSYSVGAIMPFGLYGHYEKASKYFVYEADEFDRNFLSFEPVMSVITGVSWDHHEIFPTRDDYQQAFRDFISQSERTLLWQEDQDYLSIEDQAGLTVEDSQNKLIREIKLDGQYNRLDAFLAVKAVHQLTKVPVDQLIKHINDFPGLNRRMEPIIDNLYTDYAHTPEKIRGGMSAALERASHTNQSVVVFYEPLTDRRQHHIIDNYGDCFEGAKVVYWLPSYLAREDPKVPVLPPAEIIKHLADPSIAKPIERTDLTRLIKQHLADKDMVVCMSGGGSGSLDEWLRENFKASAD